MDYTNLIYKKLAVNPLAQYIIVDTGIPTPANMTENIFNVIQSITCLGQSRIPVLGAAVVNATFQQVLSLSSTQSQLSKILCSLKSITDMGKCRARISMSEFIDSVHIGIKRAMEDFQSLSSKLGEEEYSPVGLQITIFSMKTGLDIKGHTEDIVRHFTSSQLNKIQVVELLDEFRGGDYIKPFTTIPGFVELVKIPGTKQNLEKLMKQWLMDMPTEREHVRIILKDLTILCDIQECLILPTLSHNSHEKGSKTELEVIELKVIRRLASEGLCETQVFGSPIGLVATNCPKIGWINRQLNHQRFSSLNEKIMSCDDYLVAKCEVKDHPIKYFVLMPGQGLILVKSLQSAEIALPPVERKRIQVPHEVDERVVDALMSLPMLDGYKPADFPSGFYSYLIQSGLQPLNSQRQQSASKHPSDETIIFGIELKKTIKEKIPKNRKRKVSSMNNLELKAPYQQTTTECLSKKKAHMDLPELSAADQQIVNKFMSKKKQSTNLPETCVSSQQTITDFLSKKKN